MKYVLFFVSLILALLTLLNEDQRKSSLKTLLVTLTIFSFILTAYIQYQDDNESEKRTGELNSRLSLIQKENDSLSHLLLYNIIGKGYCVFSLTGAIEDGEYIGILTNANEYPSFDIILTISNAKDLMNCKRFKEGLDYVGIERTCAALISKNLSKTNVSPSTSVYLPEYKLTTLDTAIYLEAMSISRNSKIIQQSYFRLYKGDCPQETRIFDISDKKRPKLIFNNVSDERSKEWDNIFIPVKNRELVYDYLLKK